MSITNPANQDPFSGEAGSHPVGTGAGAGSGALAGAALGTLGGPIGVVAGAVLGAIAGAGAYRMGAGLAGERILVCGVGD